jgi:D-sedoheptulose 7-phosphate isomerase
METRGGRFGTEIRMCDLVRLELETASQIIDKLRDDPEIHAQVLKMAALCTAALSDKRKILIAGNGGSAADAQHWAGELVSRFYYDRPGLPALALTTDTSVITAIANDYGYDYVFARQIEALGNTGDVFIGVSTSGKSKSIIRALHASRERGLLTLGFTGASGGEMSSLCDVCLRIPSDQTPRIQEGHEILGHILCALIERNMFSPHEQSSAS